jgi:hypothetical protein
LEFFRFVKAEGTACNHKPLQGLTLQPPSAVFEPSINLAHYLVTLSFLVADMSSLKLQYPLGVSYEVLAFCLYSYNLQRPFMREF